MRARIALLILILQLLLSLNGCVFIPKVETSLKKIDQLVDPWESMTQIHQDLMSLPKPMGKVPVSVFSFKDQTGQYKTNPSSSFSTVVTQGGIAMLISALHDSGWFLPLEREGLQDLLTERKIIRAHLGEQAITPLVGSAIIIEGGIIAYDSNIKTGGQGAKYFGIGNSEEYRVDALTVNLRTIDTQSGKIIHSVNVSSTILSQQVSASVFRFVKFKRLLEAEMGFTHNEPAQLVLRDAIDTAVIRLVILGLAKQQWQLEDSQQLDHATFKSYANEGLLKTLLQQKQNAQNKQATKQKQNNQPAPVATASPADQSTPLSKPTPFSKPTPLINAKSPTSTPKPPSPQNKSEKKESAAQTAENQFVIQLATSDDFKTIKQLQTEWQPRVPNLKIVPQVRDNKRWYALQTEGFNSMLDAESQLNALPRDIAIYDPWIKLQQVQTPPSTPKE